MLWSVIAIYLVTEKFFFVSKKFTLSTNIAIIFTIFGRGHNGQFGLKVWSQKPFWDQKFHEWVEILVFLRNGIVRNILVIQNHHIQIKNLVLISS